MSRKDEILAEIARSREAIARDCAGVRAEVDLAAKVRRSVRTHPLAWLGGAGALGFLFAGPRRRTIVKHVEARPKKRGGGTETRVSRGPAWWATLLALVKFLLPFVRPALSAYAARRLGEFAEKMAK